MQKDYMGMMQGQAAPAQEQLSPEEAQAIQENEPFNDADFEEMGMTPGSTPEALKARVVELLERLGFLDGTSGQDKMELMQDIDNFVQAILAGDEQTANASPINDMLGSFDNAMETMDTEEQNLMSVKEELGGMGNAGE
jgi:hypothetical protein